MKRILILAVVAFALSGGVATAAKLITSKDIKNGTVAMSDLSTSVKRAIDRSVGPRGRIGPPGPRGFDGAQGPQGPTGPASSNARVDVTLVEENITVDPNSLRLVTAVCPDGQVVVGTGFDASDMVIHYVRASDTRVEVQAQNPTNQSHGLTAQALCATGVSREP